MPATIESTSTAPADDLDVRCLRCEYNLRGLDRAGKCPECGEPIEASWERYELQRKQGWVPLYLSSPGFLRGMGWGCALVLVSAFIEAALVSVVMVLRNPVNFLWIFQGSWFLERASVGSGLWLLSMREPANAGDRRLFRYVIRVAAFAQFSDVVSVAARELVGLPILNRYMEPVLMLEAIIVATASWGGYLRLGRLMHCDRSSRILATAARVLAWVWPALMIIQAFQFQSMRAGSRLYLPMPIPLVGEVEAGVLALYGLVSRQYFVSDFWFWTIAVGLTIGSVLLLLRIGVKFFVVAAHGQRIIACPPNHC